MPFKSFEFLKDIEKLINKSYNLPIFKGYKAINKRGVEKLIDEIYANLPADVSEARKYLEINQIKINNTDNKNLYENLKDLKIEIDKSIPFTQYVILNVKQLENILNRIYENMPQEIVEARKNNKL